MSEAQIDGLADSGRVAAERDLQAAISNVIDALPSGHSPHQCQDCGGLIEPIRRELLAGTVQCAGCARRGSRVPAPSLN